MQIAVVLLIVALRYILNVIRLCECHELHMTFGPPQSPPALSTIAAAAAVISVLNIYHHVTFTASLHAILAHFIISIVKLLMN